MELGSFVPGRDIMRRFETDIELTEEQEAEAAYLKDILVAKARVGVRQMAPQTADCSHPTDRDLPAFLEANS